MERKLGNGSKEMKREARPTRAVHFIGGGRSFARELTWTSCATKLVRGAHARERGGFVANAFWHGMGSVMAKPRATKENQGRAWCAGARDAYAWLCMAGAAGLGGGGRRAAGGTRWSARERKENEPVSGDSFVAVRSEFNGRDEYVVRTGPNGPVDLGGWFPIQRLRSLASF